MITLVNCVAPHTDKDPGIPPPGLLSLAASVQRAGFQVRIADLASTGQAGLPTPEDFPRWLGDTTSIVGFSSMSNMLPYALEAARCLKITSPQTTIIFGGCGAQAAVKDLLERFPFVDFAFQGEADFTFPEFLRKSSEPEAWPRIDGLAYRINGSIHVNPPPPRVSDLDVLPQPAYNLIDVAVYRNYVGLLTSRGCPFSCTYCEGGTLRRKLVTHSIDRVFAEIKFLQTRYSISRIGLVDDTFTALSDRAARFCRQYLAQGWDFQWGALARVDGMDESLMRLFAQSHCQNIYFGVESGSDKTLQAVRKGVTRRQICEVVPRAKEHFQDVFASLMWGFPFEELEDLEETLLLVAYLRTYGIKVQLHLWSPMPRSTLFQQYRTQLVYDPRVQSNIVLGDVARYESLISSNPTIFAPFFHVPHPDFEQKRKMVESMGFSG
jgi:radical SAM superfamily enzyme YgiQ (UPF0313 family)